VFQNQAGLFAGHGGEAFQKFLEAIIVREVFEQEIDGNAGTPLETSGSTVIKSWAFIQV